MVGAARLELTTPRSQSECATNCAMPRFQKYHEMIITQKIIVDQIYLKFFRIK